MSDQQASDDRSARLPEYREVQPGVRFSQSVPEEYFSVAPEVSRTGQKIDFQIPSNTVVFTPDDLKGYKSFAVAATAENGNGIRLKEHFEQVRGWAGVSDPEQSRSVTSAFVLDTKQADGTRLEKKGFAITGVGEDGALIRVDRDPMEAISMLGVSDPSQLNVPQAYIVALNSLAVDHELHHERGSVEGKTEDILRDEIRADFGSLRDHFNKPFNDFVMQARALGALNFSDDNDHHSTHIWEEEGLDTLPTDQQVRDIDRAPGLIQARAVEYFSGASDMSPEDVKANLQSTAGRYATYKALHENHAFDDIPYAREFVDKYLAAAEKLYSPKVLEEAAEVQSGYDEIAAQAALDNGVAPAAGASPPPQPRMAAAAP